MLCRSREGTGPTPVTGKRRELHLDAFLMEAGHHEASWRLPDSNPRADNQPPPAAIMVPVGPDGGAGQRPDSADLVPAEVVAQLKGRDMMV
jgi:hypothetical protein